jgi:hypothetical protein
LDEIREDSDRLGVAWIQITPAVIMIGGDQSGGGNRESTEESEEDRESSEESEEDRESTGESEEIHDSGERITEEREGQPQGGCLEGESTSNIQIPQLESRADNRQDLTSPVNINDISIDSVGDTPETGFEVRIPMRRQLNSTNISAERPFKLPRRDITSSEEAQMLNVPMVESRNRKS